MRRGFDRSGSGGVAEIGIRSRLKICRLRPCGFESHRPYQAPQSEKCPGAPFPESITVVVAKRCHWLRGSPIRACWEGDSARPLARAPPHGKSVAPPAARRPPRRPPPRRSLPRSRRLPQPATPPRAGARPAGYAEKTGKNGLLARQGEVALDSCATMKFPNYAEAYRESAMDNINDIISAVQEPSDSFEEYLTVYADRVGDLVNAYIPKGLACRHGPLPVRAAQRLQPETAASATGRSSASPPAARSGGDMSRAPPARRPPSSTSTRRRSSTTTSPTRPSCAAASPACTSPRAWGWPSTRATLRFPW